MYLLCMPSIAYQNMGTVANKHVGHVLPKCSCLTRSSARPWAGASVQHSCCSLADTAQEPVDQSTDCYMQRCFMQNELSNSARSVQCCSTVCFVVVISCPDSCLNLHNCFKSLEHGTSPAENRAVATLPCAVLLLPCCSPASPACRVTSKCSVCELYLVTYCCEQLQLLLWLLHFLPVPPCT